MKKMYKYAVIEFSGWRSNESSQHYTAPQFMMNDQQNYWFTKRPAAEKFLAQCRKRSGIHTYMIIERADD
jgi:hypothetical protein